MIGLVLLLMGCTPVIEPPVTSIAISGPLEVEVGRTIKLNVDTTAPVDWMSDNSGIASVTNGLVTGIAQGTVTITVELVSNITVFDQIDITVVPSEDIDENDIYAYYPTKILSIDEDNRYIELLNCPYTRFATDLRLFQVLDEHVYDKSLDDIYIGLENIYAKVNTETSEIEAMLIDGDYGFRNIRVAIRRLISNIADESQIYHTSISFNMNARTTMQTFDGMNKYVVPSGGTINIIIYNQKMRISLGSEIILETTKRVIFEQQTDSTITFSTITRGMGVPSYAGNMEVSMVGNRLLVVNDVDLENYLTKVVPSEMPSSYRSEALKSQAIAARTYAYMDILNKSNDVYGYTVDDSIKSQVYNNQSTNYSTTDAVNQTRGIIMMHDGTPVQAFYYSTSSGLTANAHDVWITTGVGTPIPYLIGQNLATDTSGNPIVVDPSDESSMLAFFKTIRMNTPDISTTNHRWRVTMTNDQLSNTINTNLKITYANSPTSVLTWDGSTWVSQAIPSSIGSVTNIYVSERGTSGVIVSLVIETTSGTYKIINQYNIRFTIRPMNAGSTVLRHYASNTDTNYRSQTASNDSILLSGFFAIEATDDGFIFYGGGNGHGVGMSQNGANGLAAVGYTYQQILTLYYSNITLTDISYEYEPELDYLSVFEFIDHIG